MEQSMVAYEFYLRTEKGNDLIGILPERRKDVRRITLKSILNWGIEVLGENRHGDHIFFVKVIMNEHLDETSRLNQNISEESRPLVP
jgi:hypothetical protein